jgi:hypothetical protein
MEKFVEFVRKWTRQARFGGTKEVARGLAPICRRRANRIQLVMIRVVGYRREEIIS